mmetsp:Transcript_31516/g.71603  ORF Transcript_31516/g.71603 Transcript_31516/m.71603 type:complete len:249 (+) Transcript_31516:83-829(+)
MGNRLQAIGGDGCTPQTCGPNECCQTEQGCRVDATCCEDGSMSRLSFNEIKRLIHDGQNLAMDEGVPNGFTAMEASPAVRASSPGGFGMAQGGGEDSVDSHLAHGQALEAAKAEETTAEDGAFPAPSVNSRASSWSLESEQPLKLNERVLESAEEALRMLRGATEPGVDAQFGGFVEVGTLDDVTLEDMRRPSTQGGNLDDLSPVGVLPPASPRGSELSDESVTFIEGESDLSFQHEHTQTTSLCKSP